MSLECSVAKKIVASALKRRPPFMIYWGFEGWMVSTLTAGMCPLQTNVNAFCQILLMGLFRFISLFYLMDFRRIIEKAGNRDHVKK
jgi:3-dehydrosphinganine reductase